LSNAQKCAIQARAQICSKFPVRLPLLLSVIVIINMDFRTPSMMGNGLSAAINMDSGTPSMMGNGFWREDSGNNWYIRQFLPVPLHDDDDFS
jgi:hypothetical protein